MLDDFRQLILRAGALAASAACLAVFTAAAHGEEIGFAPTPWQGALLLRNGEAIEGKIVRTGDLYCVALPNGEIRVPAAEVELCCRDLEEGYRSKRAAIRVGNVHEHLRMARWCLRHGLLGPAARELADALEADPTHPMIGVLERQLKSAMDPPPKSSQPAKPVDPSPSPDDLKRLIRGMPPGSVETFTQTIQPLMMNHCAAAGCHGPGSKADFRLLRVPARRPASRLLTQRNLQATLQWIDREQPAASRLLSATIRPHGTAKTAIFAEDQVSQYRRLVDWVYQTTERARPKVPATVALQKQPPVQAMPAESPDFLFPPPEASPLEDGQPAAASPVPGPAIPRSPVKRGAPLQRFVPVDPFDAEIFNRRFFRNGGESSSRKEGP